MTDNEQKRIFSKNLNRYIHLSGKNQKEIAKDLGINPTTFNMWCRGNSMPGTGKIRTLADYFKIGMTCLTDEKDTEDDELSETIIQISLNDKRFANIIIAYKNLSDDKKDVICDFFEKFII